MTESYLSGTKGRGSERTSGKSTHDFLAVTEGSFPLLHVFLCWDRTQGLDRCGQYSTFKLQIQPIYLFKKCSCSFSLSFSLFTLIYLPRFEIGSYTVAQAGLKLTIFYLSLLCVQIPDRCATTYHLFPQFNIDKAEISDGH